MSDSFDEKELMSQLEDDVEFLEETVGMLDEEGPALLDEIREAASAGDAAALIRPAHALKGMVANFCAPRAESAAQDLEMMGREERLADVEPAVARAEQEVDRLRLELTNFVRGLSP